MDSGRSESHLPVNKCNTQFYRKCIDRPCRAVPRMPAPLIPPGHFALQSIKTPRPAIGSIGSIGSPSHLSDSLSDSASSCSPKACPSFPRSQCDLKKQPVNICQILSIQVTTGCFVHLTAKDDTTLRCHSL